MCGKCVALCLYTPCTGLCVCSYYRGSLDRQSALAERRHSREHDRRDISRLQLDEQPPVRLRKKSKEAFAVKNKPIKYVDVLFADLFINYAFH